MRAPTARVKGADLLLGAWRSPAGVYSIDSMVELARPRLFVVTSAPHAAADHVVDLLASMTVRPAPAALLAPLDDLAAGLDASLGHVGTDIAARGCGAATSEHAVAPLAAVDDALDVLRAALRAADVPPALAYRAPVVGTWLATFLRIVDAAGMDPATIVAWQPPLSVAAGASVAARALSLARWEMTLRTVLEATSGRACVVLPPAGSDRVPSVLAGALGVSPPTGTGREARQASDAGPPHPGLPRQAPASAQDTLLSSQLELADVLTTLEGAHDELAAELPVASLWSTGLCDAERRARAAAADAATAWERTHERAFDADVLWGALLQASKELAELVALGITCERRRAHRGTAALTASGLAGV